VALPSGTNILHEIKIFSKFKTVPTKNKFDRKLSYRFEDEKEEYR
jgi:hypothetical protein